MNRTQEIIDYIKNGLTIEQVGGKFGVSKQRISQIIKPYREELKPYYKKPKSRGRRDFVKFRCRYCGEEVVSHHRYYVPAFCSQECRKKQILNPR